MTNPLLDDIHDGGSSPSVEIALPTLGYFYSIGEVLSDGADPSNMAVYPLSVIDESLVRDPMMMVSGRAIVKMIKRIVPGVADPGRLSDIDVQVILMACRMGSYGPEMKLDHECPKCKHQNAMMLDLNEHILRYAPFTADELAQFDLTLTRVGQQVRLKPISYEDTTGVNIKMIRSNMGFDSIKDITNEEALADKFIDIYKTQFESVMSANVDALVGSIQYVVTRSGKTVTDTNVIREWVLSLPPSDGHEIMDRMKSIHDSIREKSRIEYQCQGCSETNTIYVELDPQKLFLPAEGSKVVPNSFAKSKTIEQSTKRPSRVSRK